MLCANVKLWVDRAEHRSSQADYTDQPRRSLDDPASQLSPLDECEDAARPGDVRDVDQGRAEHWSSLRMDDCESMDQAEQWSSHYKSSSQNIQTITRCPTITGSVARYVDRPVINMHDQEITFVQIQGIDGRAEHWTLTHYGWLRVAKLNKIKWS